jgi:hypothetical protein
MKNLLDPEFIESALSDFQVVKKHFSFDVFSQDSVFERAEEIRKATNAHLLKINKAYGAGDRDLFFALFQVILKQEQDRNE